MLTRNTRIGLLLTLAAWSGLPALRADEPVAPPTTTAVQTAQVSYQGRSYEEWVTEFRSEIDPALRRHSLKALVAFGANGKAKEVAPLLLELLDGYNGRAGMLLMGVFDESSAEIEAILKQDQLPPGFTTLGFADTDDLRLYIASSRGLVRLAPRATSTFVEYLEQPNPLSAGRIAAMHALLLEAPGEWLQLVPKLAARDDLTAMVVLRHFALYDSIGVDGISNEAYEECVKQLFKIDSASRLVLFVNALGSSRHDTHRAMIVPLLEDLQQRTTDKTVKNATTAVLSAIRRKQDKESKVVPASVRE